MALSIRTKSSTFQCKISPCLIAGEKLCRYISNVSTKGLIKNIFWAVDLQFSTLYMHQKMQDYLFTGLDEANEYRVTKKLKFFGYDSETMQYAFLTPWW